MEVKDIKSIAVHCSATPPYFNIGAEEIDRWHKKRGWSGIGYHFVIRLDGTIELGRPLNSPGAHVKGFNDESWGICLVGGVDEDGNAENNYRPVQMQSLNLLLRTLTLIAKQAEVKGHRDYPDVKKECPCFDVKTWWRVMKHEFI